MNNEKPNIVDHGFNGEGVLRDAFAEKIASLPAALGLPDAAMEPSEQTESHGPYTMFYEEGFFAVRDYEPDDEMPG